ncbi:TadE/TadG family type IV pilus assembly protein [Rhodobacter sp. CZR27]|uniref:TadE/TadG family type IV pilus assembly protein n=1 Tax=Rhodobacter sp. CZR27 TaxID=2033869 RepID=UPI000BBF273E|nr:TadE/TadG family type IV pilus assembly protein [Rhodobacter sp. CZR27]
MIRPHHRIARFGRDEDGTTLVEMAIVLPIFLLIFLALIDFGRLGADHAMAQKAMERASRIAAVRPPACPGVPTTNLRGGSPSLLPFGTMCDAAADLCAPVGRITCPGEAGNATAAEIWGLIGPILPPDATIANLSFTYDQDEALGFLGGPYVPVVTVELEGVTFRFVTPLAALAALAGAGNSTLPMTLPMPRMSVSLPGEDLALGENG